MEYDNKVPKLAIFNKFPAFNFLSAPPQAPLCPGGHKRLISTQQFDIQDAEE